MELVGWIYCPCYILIIPKTVGEQFKLNRIYWTIHFINYFHIFYWENFKLVTLNREPLENLHVDKRDSLKKIHVLEYDYEQIIYSYIDHPYYFTSCCSRNSKFRLKGIPSNDEK